MSLENEDGRHRLSQYKRRSIICDQEARRSCLLAKQKNKRDERINERRKLGLFEDLYVSTCEEFPEVREDTNYGNLLMLSEWMLKVPEDLQKWMFVLCPVGRRCILLTWRGRTSDYNKRGRRMARFSSQLPGGGSDPTAVRQLTVLDCIQDRDGTYHVLDLLYWKNRSFTNTDFVFRQFWIKSKFAEEMPLVGEVSECNQRAIVPLGYHPCEPELLTRELCRSREGEPPLDGVLFYHPDSHYLSGPESTPLVLWLKPFMVPELFENMTIPQSLLNERPINYSGMDGYIETFEETRRKRKAKERFKIEAREVEMWEEGKEEHWMPSQWPRKERWRREGKETEETVELEMKDLELGLEDDNWWNELQDVMDEGVEEVPTGELETQAQLLNGLSNPKGV